MDLIERLRNDHPDYITSAAADLIEAQAAQLQEATKFLMIQLNAIEAFGITGGASDEVRAFLAKSQ
jgi:hypothetical protein